MRNQFNSLSVDQIHSNTDFDLITKKKKESK